MHNSSPETILLKGLKDLSQPHTPEHVRLFLIYLSELKRWNMAYNLTSLKSDEDIIVKHFLDSLLYLKGMPEGEMSVMDVGSGAGFPGIPLKIMRPEIFLYLLEPSRKKATFLRHMVKLLGFDAVEVIEKRVEELKSPAVDAAVTRALFTIKDFCEKAMPLVKRRGRLILSKGPKVKEELKEVEGKKMKFEILALRLPLTDIHRFMVIVTKDLPDRDSSGDL